MWVWTISNLEVEWFAQYQTGTVSDFIGSIQSQGHLLSPLFKEKGKMQSHVATLDLHILNCSGKFIVSKLDLFLRYSLQAYHYFLPSVLTAIINPYSSLKKETSSFETLMHYCPMMFIDKKVIQMLENLIAVPWHFLSNYFVFRVFI